jgi:hypothetical protein
MNTVPGFQKVRNVERDPRVAVCVAGRHQLLISPFTLARQVLPAW